MSALRIPRSIDAPPMLLMWQVDDAAPFLLALVVGFFMGKVLVFSIVGLVASNLYMRFRDGRPDGFLWHALYSLGLMPTRAKTIRNPFQTQFFP